MYVEFASAAIAADADDEEDNDAFLSVRLPVVSRWELDWVKGPVKISESSCFAITASNLFRCDDEEWWGWCIGAWPFVVVEAAAAVASALASNRYIATKRNRRNFHNGGGDDAGIGLSSNARVMLLVWCRSAIVPHGRVCGLEERARSEHRNNVL